VPAADLQIHGQVARITKAEGISVRNDVLFSNDKGEEKSPIQKSSEQACKNWCLHWSDVAELDSVIARNVRFLGNVLTGPELSDSNQRRMFSRRSFSQG
jgi:hypothetical protein